MALSPPPPQRRRLVIVGIDGATWNVIDPMFGRGLLPGLAKMARGGARGPLESTRPPLSPAAWTSIFTGVGPGTHGIFGFTRRKEGSYFIRPVSSKDRSAEPVWRTVSKWGLTTVALNIPFAFPPDRVLGVMTTGLGTPSRSSAFTYPEEFREELLERHPGYDVDFSEDLILLGKEQDPVRRVLEVTREQVGVCKDLYDRIEWDLFISVFRSTDVLQHYFWEDQKVLDECYSQVDDLVGWILDRLDERTLLMVCSDHGFGRVRKRVNMNVWLRDMGFLRQRAHGPRNPIQRVMPSAERMQSALIGMGLKGTVNRLKGSKVVEGAMRYVFPSEGYDYFNEIDWPATRAYFMNGSYGQILLNLAGREPEGCVRPGDVEGELRALERLALALKDPVTGEGVIGSALMGSSLYGDARPDRPDLVLLAREGYTLVAGGLGDSPLFEAETRKIADHAQYGVVLACGRGVRSGVDIEGASVLDITPTVLRWLGVSTDQPIEGKPLECIDWGRAGAVELRAAPGVRRAGARGANAKRTG